MKKGFTLIELLVVVLIIGILAAIALPQYTKAVEKSRAAEAVQNAAIISLAADRYIMANGSGPKKMDELDIDIGECNSTASTCKTKNFSYGISSGNYVQARRTDETYFIENFFSTTTPKTVFCAAEENSEDKIKLCKSLTGASTKTKTAKSGTRTYDYFMF
ncbi:prepilin-type N-terminal cleavage/methylation domain-containing protein [Elusimicrobium posterum]|uniref:type IV pilin protein n=1 Tax=Elusimicrobium posterum TaxID=3116653 RepID=UPI003C7340CA